MGGSGEAYLVFVFCVPGFYNRGLHQSLCDIIGQEFRQYLLFNERRFAGVETGHPDRVLQVSVGTFNLPNADIFLMPIF